MYKFHLVSYELVSFTNNVTHVSFQLYWSKGNPPPLAARLIPMASVHPGYTAALAARSWVDLIRPVPGKNAVDFATLTETTGSFYKCMPLSLFHHFSENTL